MRNFWRVVRMALRHRVRYALAVTFALTGAIFFGGNIAAILPVLKVLLKDQTLQEYAAEEVRSGEQEIAELQQKIAKLEAEIDANTQGGPNQTRSLDESASRANLKALQFDLSRREWKLEWKKYAERLVRRYVPNDRFKTLGLIMIALLVGFILTSIFDFFNEVLVASVAEMSMLDLRNQFFHHVMRMELSGFTQQGTSELMARFTSDMKALGMGIEAVLGKVIREPIKAVVCICLACWINWQLTLVALILVPMALLVMSVIGNYIKRAARRSLETMSSIYRLLQESFQGVKIVKAFTMEAYERLRFYRETRNYYRKAMRIARLEALAGPVMGLVAMSAVLAAALAGSHLVITRQTHILGIRMADHVMGPESMVMLFGFLFAASDPFRKVSGVYARVQKAAPAADRIFGFMDSKKHLLAIPAGAPRLPRHEKSIELEGVHFAYTESKSILRDINLKVRFGETIAIVGPNGCGKTTLVSLLPRFYDPQQGQVSIDGVDVRQVQRRSLRRQFGVVTQETILFNDTVYNNIAYGRLHATRDEVVAAAKKAHAHRFIEDLPHGYDTVVGEKAVKISGGQRQRIALARAILRDPAILILDEATSALDVESEALIQKVLEEFTRNRTTFLITHRLATLQLADRIIVMNEGRIEDHGTHEELQKRCPLYSRLHEVHEASRYLAAG